MKHFIAWLKSIWNGPIDPQYWHVLDRCDDQEFVVELWRHDATKDEVVGQG